MPFTGATIPAPAPSGTSGGMSAAPVAQYSEDGVDYYFDQRGGLVPMPAPAPTPVSSISAAAPTPAPAGFGGGLQVDPGWAGSSSTNPIADLVKTNPDAAIAKALEGPQLVTYYNELKNQAASDPSFAKQYGSKIEGLKNIIDTTAYSIAEQGGQGISAGQMAILKPLDPAILAQAKEAAKTAGEEGSTSFRGANGQLYTVSVDPRSGEIQSISIPKSQGDWIATAQKDWLQANWDASGKANPTGLSNKGNNFFGGLFSGISDIGKSIDDLVHEIPGNWATVGALAGGYLAGPGAAGAGYAGDVTAAGYDPLFGASGETAASAGFLDPYEIYGSGANQWGAAGAGLTGAVGAAAGAGAGAGAGLAGLAGLTAADVLKYGALAGLASKALSPQQQQPVNPNAPDQTPVGRELSPAYQPYRYKPYAAGGEVGGLSAAAQRYNLGGYSDGGRLLKGPGDGVSDSIPATIGAKKQPARLADGEFVVPARIVSELGNGSTEAGARKLYAMMDRIQAARKKSVGKGKVAVNSRADKYLPK